MVCVLLDLLHQRQHLRLLLHLHLQPELPLWKCANPSAMNRESFSSTADSAIWPKPLNYKVLFSNINR
jgi:hypothetical protein